MDQETIERIHTILGDVDTNRQKFGYYIHSLIARFCYFEKNGFYDSFADAWDSRSASALKAYLASTTDISRDKVSQLAELMIPDTRGRNYVKYIIPSLFIGDVDSVFDYLSSTQIGSSLRNNIYSLLKLLAVLLLREEFYYRTNYPSVVTRITSDKLPALIYKAYKESSV